MLDTNWDVDKYRSEHESEEHWGLRRQFMVAHKHKYPETRLVCLAQVFFNMEFLGCKYPEETMDLVNQLAAEVAEEFRESRKDKLKRTFVGAQDAAGAKAKGIKPPPGVIEGTSGKQQAESSDIGSAVKKPRLEEEEEKHSQEQNVTPPEQKASSILPAKDHTADLREVSKTFDALIIPPRANSKTETDPVCIMHFNFQSNKISFNFKGSKQEGGWTCEVKINPLPNASGKPKHCIASTFAPTQREGKTNACTLAIEGLKKFCNVLEPNPEWFKEGKTPDFIKDKIPCKKNPRSYLIMSKKDTGHITAEVADLLMKNFKMSSNEDMFFLDSEYNEKEKIHIMNTATKQKLGFRHFGAKTMLKDHHVCIYKMKTARDILEEAKKLNWTHPKYLVTLKNPETSAKSPPRPNWGM